MRSPKIVIILLIVTVGLFATTIVYGCKTVTQSKQIDTLNKDMTQFVEVITELNSKIIQTDGQVVELQNELESAKIQNEQLQEDIKTLNEKPKWIEKWVIATGYCPCEICCGKTNGITASGELATEGVTLATSRGYDFGTEIHIPSMDNTYIVQDRGGAIKSGRIDVFFNFHSDALKFGKQRIKIYVKEEW